MASESSKKPCSEGQPKAPGSQSVEVNAHGPSHLQTPKLGDPEFTASHELRIRISGGQKPDHRRKGSIDSFPAKVASEKVMSLEDDDATPLTGDQEKPTEGATSVEPLLVGEAAREGSGGGQEKQSSEQCSAVNSSSVSAKVSDGASSLGKTSGSAKVNDRAEFIESGKSSICRGSTSSDVSDESTCSSVSSGGSKPHKANDSRWEAIKSARAREGFLGLKHFRLLRRLGCGDIGSVYLSELSGTRCCFAVKVMDKGSLASRKKLLRAQTEREILQCLDHPFLPTLYTHFETDKFSCLVMEFCPGGDLHTLRQRQPGKFFSEQAAK